MKTNHVILMVLFALSLTAFASRSEAAPACESIQQDVNTPVPKELEDGEIIIRTKDGKERKMSANEFKVVKRKQQFKVRETVKPCEPVFITTEVREIREVESLRKNTLMLSARRDFTRMTTDVSTSGSSTTARVNSEKNLVLGLDYLRRDVFNTHFGLGAGVDSNGTLKGILGYDF